jgi:hypothetical protein
MTIRVPLTEKIIEGSRCDRPLIVLEVLTRFGDWVAVPFLVDTGSDHSCVPTAKAQKEGIPFDRSHPGISAGLVGRTRRYRGALQRNTAPELWRGGRQQPDSFLAKTA